MDIEVPEDTLLGMDVDEPSTNAEGRLSATLSAKTRQAADALASLSTGDSIFDGWKSRSKWHQDLRFSTPPPISTLPKLPPRPSLSLPRLQKNFYIDIPPVPYRDSTTKFPTPSPERLPERPPSPEQLPARPPSPERPPSPPPKAAERENLPKRVSTEVTDAQALNDGGSQSIDEQRELHDPKIRPMSPALGKASKRKASETDAEALADEQIGKRPRAGAVEKASRTRAKGKGVKEPPTEQVSTDPPSQHPKTRSKKGSGKPPLKLEAELEPKLKQALAAGAEADDQFVPRRGTRERRKTSKVQ
jgi:hypothetical protein